jgi:hypothetical protein
MESGLLSHLVTLQLLFRASSLPVPSTLSQEYIIVVYLAAAEKEDLQAIARVLRRGRSLVYLDVEVRSASGSAVARGLVTYKLG